MTSGSIWHKMHPVYRSELPRIHELRDLLGRRASTNAHFRDLDASLSEIPQKLQQFRRVESDLQALDSEAWAFLKSEVGPLLKVRDCRRGWQALFDRLNQAKAYQYLRAAGYETVRFIPSTPLRPTPDLEAVAQTGRALCEVKTINITGLDCVFLKKLGSRVDDAVAQMAAYDPDPAVTRIVYVVINFDDRLHEDAGRYADQIDQYMREHADPGREVVFDWQQPLETART